MKVIGEEIFYSTDEAARLLGVTPRTLHRWVTEHKTKTKHVIELKAYFSPTGRRFFKEKDIHAIVNRCWGIQLSPRRQRITGSNHAVAL